MGFVTLPGYEGLYFQGMGVNLEAEEFAFEVQNYNENMIIAAPQLSDWGETSADQTIPAVNQVECNPFFQKKELRELLKQDDVKMEAYMIGSQKGGTAKTTTTFNLAYCLRKMGALEGEFYVEGILRK